jgi:ketosteroid isomerase-like protein
VSREHVDSFFRGVDAWNRRDFEASVEWLHPDAELHPGAVGGVEGRAYRGREGLRRFWADIDEAFDELSTSFDDVRDLGDAVLGLGQMRGRSKQGVPVDFEYALLVRYRDGRVVWAQSWYGHEEALAAAGLPQ